MPQETHIICDVCGAKIRQDNTAGNTVGWVQRSITDTVTKTLMDGVHRFSGSQVLWLCPVHAKAADRLEMPATHHEVVEFIDQKEETSHV